MEIKYLLLALPLLLLAGCDGNKPKFHYNDCVRVEEEFYGPTYGVVTTFNPWGSIYTVFRRIGNKQKEFVISEGLLTKVDSGYCSDIVQTSEAK